MTTHELPEEPVFAFTPAYELPDQPQQIRIVFEGMDGYIPTALVALDPRRCGDGCATGSTAASGSTGRRGASWSRGPWPPAARDGTAPLSSAPLRHAASAIPA